MTLDLFQQGGVGAEQLASGTSLLHGFVSDQAGALLADIARVETEAPFRQMVTPGGHSMSAFMTNCGPLGWTTDRSGYRYTSCDPVTGRPWPAMPEGFRALAREAAQKAGYPNFDTDACLINRYLPGSRMGLHQDRNEQDYGAPIVSVSLGLPVVFLFGGLRRNDKPLRLTLNNGDVLVWGGPDRLRYHGVNTLKPGCHELTGNCRINLTFRKAS
ncbi:MAG: DNA oxidative demethylase AlkB [Oleiphilaceae bacterium]|nr:DNA oxidative demethylase AlkB [Oleiphilaceae bacterium]